MMIQTWHITPRENIKLELDAASLDDVTRQLADGYYSTFRTYGECTRVLGLASHLRRLYEPVSAPEVDVLSLRRQLHAVLESYRPGEARVRAVMTKQGESYLAIEPLKSLPRETYENGVRAETTELQREDPRLKSTTFIGRRNLERMHIAQEGIFEALLVKHGKILEGMSSNFFYIPQVERGEEHPWRRLQRRSAQRAVVLCTARDDILLGVTRETVIEIARGRGMEVEYRTLRWDQIKAADEAFITSSSRGIVPVIQIDSITIGQGTPGPITRELTDAYDAYVQEHAETI